MTITGEPTPNKPAPRRANPAPTRAEDMALARLDPQTFLMKGIESNVSVETMTKLVDLAEKIRNWQAREAYYRAMADFQLRCPRITKSKTAEIISQRTGGKHSYDWAPLDAITKLVDPVLSDCGLSKRWDTKIITSPNGVPLVSVACIVTHELGHFESSGELQIPVPSVEEGRGATTPQRVGSALTYGKRYTFCGILGITPEDEEDDDGNGGGGQHHDDRDPPRDRSLLTGPFPPRDRVVEEPPPRSDHEQPRRPPEPTGPPPLASQISAALERHRMSTPERYSLADTYLKTRRMGQAAEADLERLLLFLGDDDAVKQWREERARDKEPDPQGTFTVDPKGGRR